MICITNHNSSRAGSKLLRNRGLCRWVPPPFSQGRPCSWRGTCCWSRITLLRSQYHSEKKTKRPRGECGNCFPFIARITREPSILVTTDKINKYNVVWWPWICTSLEKMFQHYTLLHSRRFVCKSKLCCSLGRYTVTGYGDYSLPSRGVR